jgi:predicted PurR-regulated permease PerM
MADDPTRPPVEDVAETGRDASRGGATGPGGPPDATDGLRRAGSLAYALVGVALAVAVVGYLAWVVRIIWPPLLLAAIIVFLLAPVVAFLQRRGVPRVLGVFLAYLAVLGPLALGVAAAVPVVQSQAVELGEEWPELRATIEGWIDGLSETLEGTPFAFDRQAVLDGGDDGPDVAETVRQAIALGSSLLHALLVIVLAPIIAFYVLADLPRLGRVAHDLVPPGARAEVLHLSHRVSRAVGGFLRGQLAVATIVGVLISFGLWLIGLPFWLLVGAIAGASDLVPFIGPIVGAVPAIVIALSTGGITMALWVVVVMVVVQQLESHVISPLIMNRTVHIHPVTVILAVVLGGTLVGVFGMLVAVPVVAVLQILAGHVWRTHVLGQPFDEDPDDAPGVEPGPTAEDHTARPTEETTT